MLPLLGISCNSSATCSPMAVPFHPHQPHLYVVRILHTKRAQNLIRLCALLRLRCIYAIVYDSNRWPDRLASNVDLYLDGSRTAVVT